MTNIMNWKKYFIWVGACLPAIYLKNKIISAHMYAFRIIYIYILNDLFLGN